MATRSGGAKSGSVLPKVLIWCPNTALFGPKRSRNPVKTAKQKQTVPTLHVRLDCAVTKSAFLPSSSTICRRNGPKNGEKWPECALSLSNTPKTKNGPHLGLSGSKPNSEGTYSTRNPPLFEACKPQNRPTRRLDPRTSGHLVELEGTSARARWGATVGPPWSPGRKMRFFSKLFLDYLGCSNKCFSAVLSPWWRVLRHGKSQRALKMGRFKTRNGS